MVAEEKLRTRGVRIDAERPPEPARWSGGTGRTARRHPGRPFPVWADS